MGYESSSFSISKSTRQGCPLSPLLFIIALELLAAHIWANVNIQVVEMAGITHKLALFADDMLIYISSPHTTLPNLISLMSDFASISALYVNPSKSRALNISLPDASYDSLQTHFPFQWTPSLLYLGVHIISSFCSLYAAILYPP